MDIGCLKSKTYLVFGIKLSYEEANNMYLTIKETAEYLSLPESYIGNLIQQNRIRAVYDGQQYLVNKEQFNKHLEQLEKAIQELEEWKSTPIPEDMDVKDED